MSKSITCLEYEYIMDKDNNKINLTKEIPELTKLNKLYFNTTTGERGIFNIEGHYVKTKQFVGILKVGKRNIQVIPKIFGDENSHILSNLLYMIKYTRKLDLKETNISNLRSIDDLFEIIIYLFARNLLELLKKDLTKNYRLEERNSSFLKGKLLLSKQIRTNTFNHTRFYCSFDEFDENITLNIIFKATVTKLLNFVSSNENYKLLKACEFILKDVDRKKIDASVLRCVKFDRNNEVYRPSFELAKLLLFGNSTQFDFGNINTFSLMFDMNELFEEFIGEFIQKNKNKLSKDIELVEIQPKSQFVFKPGSFRRFQLNPDMIIKYKDNHKVIIDTKYKKLDKLQPNNGVLSSDIYQMFAYGNRYFSKEEKNKKLILLYPKYNESSINATNDFVNGLVTEQEGISIYVKTIDLHQDLRLSDKELIIQLKEIVT